MGYSFESDMTASGTERGQRPGQIFWQRYFQFYDTLNESIPYLRMIEQNVELLEPAPQDHILDAGTGTGNVAIALMARCARVTGIDFCEPALVKCREKAPGGDFRYGDLTQRLEFEEGSFDKVVSCNVIYTLAPEGQKNAVGELYRVLKPGGVVVITVFGAGFRALRVYRETIRLERERAGIAGALWLAARYSVATARILYYVARIKRREKGGDYTFFTPGDLRSLIESGGFAVDRIEPTFASQCLVARASKPGKCSHSK
jgi:ubiquinone/menaquinone biosynthesis C-methylase UbiE